MLGKPARIVLISLACLIGAGLLFGFLLPYILYALFGWWGSDPRNPSNEDILKSQLLMADRTPRWSADSQRIVVNIGHIIYVVNTSDLSLHRILQERSGHYYSPSLSRTGRVAYIHHEFVRRVEGGRHHIETVDLASGQVQRVRWSSHNMYPPLISPDGSRIWIVHHSGTRIYDNEGKVASPLDVFAGYGAWSNDGQKIAYIRAKPPENDPLTTHLIVVDWDGSNEVVIPEANGSYRAPPAWSPDEKRLYYAYRPEGSEPTPLRVADLDSRATNTIAELGIGVDVLHISASPDGNALLLVTLTDARINQVWTIGTDGTDMTKIAGNVEPEEFTWLYEQRLYASWSPDGSRIAIYNSEESSLYTLEPDGSDVKVLVAGDPSGNGPTKRQR